MKDGAKRDSLRKFLTDSGRKGYIETLEIIRENEGIHYNEILNRLLDKKILRGTSYVSTILNLLVESKMVEKKADTTTRPMRTEYRITKSGISVLKIFDMLENELKSAR